MFSEYRTTLKRANPGCVCCGKFYLRQTDAAAHLVRVHGMHRVTAVAQVTGLIRQARDARKRQARKI